MGEVPWLEPYPDALLDEGAVNVWHDPQLRYEKSESISLTFVAALQVLPHRQLAVHNDESAGAVFKLSVNGGTLFTVASGQSEPGGIAISATRVYWTAGANGGSLESATPR